MVCGYVLNCDISELKRVQRPKQLPASGYLTCQLKSKLLYVRKHKLNGVIKPHVI